MSVRYQYWHGKPAIEHSWSAETYNACPCETCAKIKEDWQASNPEVKYWHGTSVQRATLTSSHTEQTSVEVGI